jgi:hypothetical protein
MRKVVGKIEELLHPLEVVLGYMQQMGVQLGCGFE